MKNTALLVSVLVTALTGCNNQPVKETETKKPDSTAVVKPATPAPPAMDPAASMKAWKDYMTPGDMHKILASLSGKWTAEVTSINSENAPAQKNTFECENKMILDGHYLQRSRTGMVMGKPFEGMGIIGYDNTKKVFVSSWEDNMSTGMLNMEGLYDAATKTITFKGNWTDPVTGNLAIKETFTMTDDKNQLIALYRSAGSNKEFKYMEMKLTRK